MIVSCLRTSDQSRPGNQTIINRQEITFCSEFNMRTAGVLLMFSLIAGGLSRPQEEVQGMMELRDIDNVSCHKDYRRSFERQNETLKNHKHYLSR